MKPGNTLRLISLACLICLCAGAPVLAQDDDRVAPVAVTTGQGSEDTENTSRMSPAVEDAEAEAATALVVTDAANGQALYMAAPGACVVVDAFVRQFCDANPGDISCQFR